MKHRIRLSASAARSRLAPARRSVPPSLASVPVSPPAENDSAVDASSVHSHPRSNSTAPDMTQEITDLVVMARRTVHPAYVEGMMTHCQCVLCVRVESALRHVAVEADRARDGALADTVVATRDATRGLATVTRAVNERDAGDARGQTLVQQWRTLAAIERAEAISPRSMSPDARSVHNHRGQVYDACADQLAAQHRAVVLRLDV